MGLNLNIRRVIFHSLQKYEGVPGRASELPVCAAELLHASLPCSCQCSCLRLGLV